LIGLSGANFCAMLNDQEIPSNATIVVGKNSVLKFIKLKSGACCYLAVNGGLEIPKWLGSFSTNLKAKEGGFEGRCLKKNDELPFNKKVDVPRWLKKNSLHLLLLENDIASLYSSSGAIRVCEGPEYFQLGDSSKKNFTSSVFSIGSQSDRMGFRMRGAPLQLQSTNELISSAVTKGTIQLFPDGQIIVLMADHQTTGGYPRIANVISTDIPVLAQMGPNASITFQFVSNSEAEDLFVQQQKHLEEVVKNCSRRFKKVFAL
jgi:antagonist of KipI